MDANGTRHKLLLGRADWARCELERGPRLGDRWADPEAPADGAGWDAERSELILQASPWRFPESAGSRRLSQAARRGAAMDRYGNWYWIDQAATGIRVLSAGSRRISTFWPDPQPVRTATTTEAGFGALRPATPAPPDRLRGLAVTDDHYLVVGTLRPSGLLVFDLRAGGPPWQLTWPPEVPFEPLDLAARIDGGVFVLAEAGTGRRMWRLDRHLRVEPLGEPGLGTDAATASPFAPLDAPTPAGPTLAPVHPIRLDDAALLAGDPVAVGVAGPDLVVVLDRVAPGHPSIVRLYDAAMGGGTGYALPGLTNPLVAHDLAVSRSDPAGGVPAGVVVVDEQGDQAYRFPLTIDGPDRVVPEFLPLRRFGGRGLVATHLGVWYDSGPDGRWVPVAAQRRPRHAPSAVVLTPVLDSREPGCVWHRVLLDGCLGPDARVRIASAASDDARELETAPAWRAEPMPYRRGDGSERPFAERPSDPRAGTWELLLQAARGRYLRLRLELLGNGETTPRIRALRTYYPRFSYLTNYLPSVYRAEPESALFVEGFLANIEGFYTAIEDRMTAADVLLDPRTAPRDALDWLASWFDVVLDPAWDERRRRLFLEHAVELFRWRGTERGLRLALGIALLACPDERLFTGEDEVEPGGIRIVERYQTKRGPASLFGDPTAAALPREAPGGARWTPADGASALHERYRAYLGRLAAAGVLSAPASERTFPVQPPGGDRLAAWRRFAESSLGFVPSATAGDAGRWERFLARRYVTVARLNAAWNRIGSRAVASFGDVDVPRTLPADGAPLADWFAFESIVLRSVRAAHRFSVLLPVPIGRAHRGTVVPSRDARDQVAEQRRVARLVELEKPAHTVFDVKSYWLAFRVGEARLGRDTLLDYGSRSPDLRPPAVLGSMHVGESVLTSAMADLPERPAPFSGVARRRHGAGREEDRWT